MKQYFNPAPSEIVERFRFYKRDQRPNESIADFVAELRRLSEHCNFGNGLDTALRDRLVCGISDESLQRRLLADQVATFDVALREALATETARLQALEIRTGSSQDDVKQVCTTTRKQMPNDNRTCSGQRSLKVDKCYRCGGGHDAQVCRFINQSCRYCQKMGHIERVCRKKIRQRKLDQRKTRHCRRKTPDRVQSHALTEQHEALRSRRSPDPYVLNTLTALAKNPIVAKVLVNVFDDDTNAYSGPPVSIELEKNATPKFLKCRPVPFAIRSKLNDALENLVKQGILKPVRYSKWATPIVPVLKRNGELRICGDYRSTVNLATKKDYKLDLSQAYQQLKVDEQTAELLTLNTPKGLLQMTRLPFGIDVAPSIFQRFMDTCLAGLDGVKAYLDDVLIMGRSEAEHRERVKAVLERLDKAGVRLKRDKCFFGVDEVEYLGFRIDKQGLHPTAEKVEAIQKAPNPRSKTELQAFLGLLNFYSSFIPGKADVLEPLHRLLDTKTAFTWKKTHEQAFKRAKEVLQSSSVLIHYDPKMKLTVTCDASPCGVGAVLSQTQSEGKEAPVAYASRTLSKTERNYAQIDKEALAIIYAVKKFHQYLYGRFFTIVTDHKPLLGLLHPHKALPQVMSPRMLRWSLMLAAYNYELLYRPGARLANADGLSRWPMPSADREIPPPGDILLLETDVETPVDARTIERLTRHDRTLARVLHWALYG
uniref:Reverse transcriptase domain-containing protein n=1 Tax=Trichuris muris TaxID=70415 RepID=A0A5S6QHL3_TRIMR